MTAEQTVQCALCPKACVIAPGQSGECRIRINLDGVLTAVTYGFPCAVHVDPVEKKPLFHFLPGTSILSVATVGCNLHCKNCQNWEISQMNPERSQAYPLSPVEVIALAEKQGCPSVAYTYTDPVVFYEYALDTCRLAHERGLRNVLVTAGYVNPGPWKELCARTDAANIDLKAFSESFYREICGATLKPILVALVLARSAGVAVEVTNLVIPTLNDSDRMLTDLCRWICANLGADTPLHFSRFWPNYNMKNLPPTPEGTLLRAREIARAEGLHFVYIGNVDAADGGTTFCPGCGEAVVSRRGFQILFNRLEAGACPACGRHVEGVWL
ncbi:MAG: AmmeMemoRadiSam system radical SAM enzyme [Kiritimatiellae bacterium]|nr:AmmeMemoRadiSam system radical SAM enzyme [Kiritimatiellia bacterium]